MHDVVIVGGGPAGCFTGELLARKGFKVLILEEHLQIGNPVSCAGILGRGGLQELGIGLDNWVLNKLRGAVFYPPSSAPLEITRDKEEALVADRAAFDRSLAKRAMDAGAELKLGNRCTGISFGEKVKVRVKGGEFGARLVVGADGPSSVVAREAGLSGRTKNIICAQVETLADISEDKAELYFGNSFSKGFFGWLVPAGEVCRVGLGVSSGSPITGLLYLLRKHPITSRKIIDGKVLHFETGLIPFPYVRKLWGDRVLLVGDAAAQTKPLTGGGVYIGLSCARMAAEVAEKALEDEPTSQVMGEYGRKVKEKFGREFEFGMRARAMWEGLDDRDLNQIFEFLNQDEVKKLILEQADFDHLGEFIPLLAVKARRLLRQLGIRKSFRFLSG